LPVDEQPCVFLERIQVQSPFKSEELQAALAGPRADDSPQGRCLGSQGITLLVQRVQEALLERGYITSRVQVPEQDLTKGTLELRVEFGRVGRIRSESNSPALPRNAFALKEGQILNLRDIEQSVDNLQRLPSLKNHIQIEPAETEGQSDLVVELEAKRPWRIGLSLDDTGNRSTGKLQGAVTFNWDNPLGLADLFYISQTQGIGQKETGPRGSRSHVVHYSVPFGYWLVGLTHSQSEYQQTVYGLNEQYLYSGSSSQSELALQRVLFRDGSRKTTASLKAFDRQSRNYIADLEVLVQHRNTAGWEAELAHLQYFQSGTFNAQLNYKRGTAAFGAQPDPLSVSSGNEDRMHLAKGLLGWEMPFTVKEREWSYSSQLQWQWSQSPLAPQDLFCVGGRTTVQGFSGQNTLCGERGQLWRQELSTTAPDSPITPANTQVYLAVDAGRTYTADLQGLPSQHLVGAALGLRGQSKVFDAPLRWDMFIGAPLSKPESFQASPTVLGFNLRTEF
jgi:hemolysin activation/secretion protein